MTAVNLWKAKKLQSHIWFTESNYKWLFVRIAENNVLSQQATMKSKIRSTAVNRFSARYSTAPHKARYVSACELKSTWSDGLRKNKVSVGKV
jgi:hypothetical protein